MTTVMTGRRIRHTRQPTLAYQMFACLLPGWDRIATWGPVSIRGFVTPFHKMWHNFCVRSGAAKRFHSSVALPHSQGPKRTPNVYEQFSSEEPGSAQDLALRKKGLP